jgi:hypothetical protein
MSPRDWGEIDAGLRGEWAVDIHDLLELFILSVALIAGITHPSWPVIQQMDVAPWVAVQATSADSKPGLRLDVESPVIVKL